METMELERFDLYMPQSPFWGQGITTLILSLDLGTIQIAEDRIPL